LLWAFVAGFSEKLIPNILDKLAGTLEEEAGTDRAHPGAPAAPPPPMPPMPPIPPAP
jgi:hypothetical protein